MDTFGGSSFQTETKNLIESLNYPLSFSYDWQVSEGEAYTACTAADQKLPWNTTACNSKETLLKKPQQNKKQKLKNRHKKTHHKTNNPNPLNKHRKPWGKQNKAITRIIMQTKNDN